MIRPKKICPVTRQNKNIDLKSDKMTANNKKEILILATIFISVFIMAIIYLRFS